MSPHTFMSKYEAGNVKPAIFDPSLAEGPLKGTKFNPYTDGFNC
jgi:hypothetical protein